MVKIESDIERITKMANLKFNEQTLSMSMNKKVASLLGKVWEEHPEMIQELYPKEFAEIKETEAMIMEKEKELMELLGYRECESCGAVVKDDSLYCSKCGTKLPEKKEETKEQEPEVFKEEK